MKKWKHDELLYDLAEHLEKPERMMWLDMPMENSGSCRPDIYTLNKSFTNPKPIAYEIKASVSDFRSDITSGKWQKYLTYASAVVFCVPQGLVTKSDIPKGCGLMVRSEAGWRTLKAPTIEKAPDLPRNTWMKLLMSGMEQEYSISRLKAEKYFNTHLVAKENFSEDVQMVLQDLQYARNRVTYYERELASKKEHYAKSLEREKEMLLSKLSSDREAVDKALSEFNSVFGFSANNIWHVRDNINHLYNKCQTDTEVTRLKGLLKSLKTTLDKECGLDLLDS